MARTGRLAVGLALMGLCGCSSGPPFAKVSGQVLVNGSPAAKVRVEFHPDATRGTTGPSSFGETDENGRFTLTYSHKDSPGEGAVVGWHKVVVQDLRLAESETGRGIPIRFGPEYATVLTTPLDQEVKAGDQTLTLEVPKRCDPAGRPSLNLRHYPPMNHVRRPSLNLLPLESREVPAVHSQLRIVDYNVAGDIRPGMNTVLDAIGTQTVAGLARPIDVMVIQESDSQATVTQALVTVLNGLYGANTYTRGTVDGSTTGAGRPGIVYRQSSVDLIAEVALSVAGMERAPMRYQLRPDGLDSSYDFYIYANHYKASQGFEAQRAQEAAGVRANADALGQGAEVLFAGDFNIYESAEPMWGTLTGAGNAQAFDPVNRVGDWHSSPALFKDVLTQNPAGAGFVGGGMDDRFDFILTTQEVGRNTVPGDLLGLEYRPNSYRAFGNDNAYTINGAINEPLTGRSYSTPVLNALATLSDHLPLVADFDVVTPDPPTVTFTAASQSGAENAGALTVTAQLSTTSSSAVSVPFTVSGTATGGGTDYTITASPISIPAGSLTGTITITPANDAFDETNETVVVTMGTPTNATPGATTVHAATITDDDPTPTVTFAAASQGGAENVGTMTVTAQLSAASGQAVTVPFTVSGTATGSGTDYTITASPITIAAGATTGTATITVVDDTDTEPSETVVLTMGTPTNATQGATTVHTATIVDNEITTLRVTGFAATASGFVADFSRAINPADLNLYDAAAGTLGVPDVTLTGPGGAVAGSLVVDPGLTRVTFVRTGGPLPAGTYTAGLRSAATGFKDALGELLDGDGNGTAGGDYSTQFTVGAPSGRLVSLPDFARGAGQPVAVPATAAGLPLTVSDVAGVTSVQADLLFDSTLLTITPGTYTTAPVRTLAGSTVTITAITGGVRVAVTGISGATGTNVAVAALPASVPATAPYASKQVIRVRNVAAVGATFAAAGDDAVHVAAYLGDATGNRQIDPLDATRVAQAAAGLATGFVAYRLADPAVVADASGNGVIDPLDGTRVAQKAAGLTVAAIPDVPTGVNPAAGGPDPRLYFPDAAVTAGRIAVLPLRMEVTDPRGIALESGTLTFAFDPAVLRVGGVFAGSMVPGFRVKADIDNVRGRVTVHLTGDRPLDLAAWADGELLKVRALVRRDAAAGKSPLNLLAATELNGGIAVLIPAPTDAADDPNDGTVTVTLPAWRTARRR